MRRPTRTTLLIAIAAALAVTLAAAPAALARAGGGTAGFGGGGEGGGGGRGAGLYFLFQILIRIAILGHGLGLLILIGLAFLYFLITRAGPAYKAGSNEGRRARRRTAQRERRVELAAAEAAEEDPAFAPETVRAAARTLYEDIQTAWDAGDTTRLSHLVAPDLMREWERRLNDFDRHGWRNRVKLIGDPKIEYVSLVNRGSNDQDRVVVRIEAKLRDYVEDRSGNHIRRAGRLSDTTRTREFWTLTKDSGNHWILQSIEQGAEGVHALDEQLIATPWSDEQGLRDESLVEGAVADAVPEGVRIASVADLDFVGDAHAAANDLSLADGRFAPDVLEVAARRAVAAWAGAVDGDDAQLRKIATPNAIQHLLHPGDPAQQTRLVVRGPRVIQIRINALDAGAEPPTMTVDVDLAGRRYIEDRATTAVVAGNPAKETTFTERWTFALNGDTEQPWRIQSVTAPAARA
jgi:predicted lipid-binding transport protein (Tim44 family)